jgi:FtsH-binding integral membrane protein
MEQTTIHEQRATDAVAASFMTKVYGWMCGALFITALTAWAVVDSVIMNHIHENPNIIWILFIAQLGLVFVISGAINRLSVQVATALFVLYSVLMGVTLSMLLYIYTEESIAITFAVTALTFGIMSFYGFVTKKDLSGMRNMLFMALIGLIIASVVNIFMKSSAIYWITTYAGILIFVGLTAYDTQKLKRMSYQIGEGETAAKMAILGALTLYLDFINMFLFLLRLFGRRR